MDDLLFCRVPRRGGASEAFLRGPPVPDQSGPADRFVWRLIPINAARPAANPYLIVSRSSHSMWVSQLWGYFYQYMEGSYSLWCVFVLCDGMPQSANRRMQHRFEDLGWDVSNFDKDGWKISFLTVRPLSLADSCLIPPESDV